MLNILLCNIVRNEQSEKPVILRDESRYSSEGLTDDQLQHHASFEEPRESALTAKAHVFSDSVFCTSPGARDEKSASDIWKTKAEDGMKSNSRKNRNDIASQSSEAASMSWRHFCEKIAKTQSIHLRNWKRTREFSRQDHFPSMFNGITNWERSNDETTFLS